MDEQTKGNSVSSLQWPDYLVIGVMLSISASIGIYYRFTGGRQRTVEEYFSADRSMSTVTLAIALTVSIVSAVSLLGVSAENYAHGTQFTLVYFGFLFGAPITIFFYFPVFIELKTMSVYEYLEKRFGVKARLLTSLANSLHLVLFTGVVLFAPSLALEATTGLSGNMSVLAIGIICTFYSTIGGIKAVLITDVFQCMLMFGGIACVLGVAANELDGGLSNVWNIAQKGERIEFFNFRFDPTIRHTWWSMMFGGIALFLSYNAVNQIQVQRLLAAKSVRVSRNALLLSTPMTMGLGILTSYTGLVLYTVYKDCDPVTAGQISSFDKIMPFFAAEKMSKFPGTIGVFVSGVFSATLSTISAVLNSLAAVALEDYVKPACRRLGVHFPDEKATLIGKVLAVMIGFISLAMAYLAKSMGGLVETALGVSGAIAGPVVGIFTLGMFIESANETGSLVGMITALSVTLWAMFGKSKPIIPNLPLSIDGCDESALHNYQKVSESTNATETSPEFYLYRISYMWYSPLGLVITLIVGYIMSLATKRIFHKNTPEPDPNLFIPLLASRIRRRRRDAEKTTNSQLFVLENRR
ncbi:putative sodium-dependent multivitamin transporter [Colletes gigas]|uniref:putative sodium-dependent multivitamin transporter n=1 Tax=Colletes gigas TaxID=935657 RepID=UPI001C9A865E|nr:putative sodium-dependent multivitamin transporter [Colletes gigas]